jgi:S-adenosylmethionine:tRNA ribosyltransferase-isomerase
MTAADRAIQRPAGAKLLVIDQAGRLSHWPRAAFADHFQPGDLVVANDAATLPASLRGTHASTGRPVEVRLAGRHSLDADDVHTFMAVVFGRGDYHTQTEHREAPPRLSAGDTLTLGPLSATIVAIGSHERLVEIEFQGTADAIWAGLAAHGRPIQYAHIDAPLALWDVWTPVASAPAAFEPPSAGFALDWRSIAALRGRGIGLVTITHAAGISSTGDPTLDALLPLEEAYNIPSTAAAAIHATRARGGRIVAIGTTVVRALEHAADSARHVRPGPGLARQRVTADTRLRVVDMLLSGVHEPGTSHFELMRAFVDDDTLEMAAAQMASLGYRTHEFGDSVLVSALAPGRRELGRFAFHLTHDHAVVDAPRRHQTVVRPALDDLSILHQKDDGCAPDRRQAVRDDERGPALQQLGHRGLDQLLALGVEVAGGFVEDENLR